MTTLRTLVCCCLAFDRGCPKFGEILTFCYVRGVLSQPQEVEIEHSADAYLGQVLPVTGCLLIMNDIHYFEEDERRRGFTDPGIHDLLKVDVLDVLSEYLSKSRPIPLLLGLDVASFFSFTPSSMWMPR